MAFLKSNPDLEEELNLVKGVKIEPETISYFDKNSLKKVSTPEISEEIFTELCISKIEKTINHDEEILLAQYLELNPEKVKDFQLFEMTILKADTTVKLENKDSLKRIEISSERFNELYVSKIENEISVEEEMVLSTYIAQNPGLKKEAELFDRTILKPDFSIQYPDKQSLKRHVVGFSYRKIVFRSLSAAAAIILIFLAYTFFSNVDKHGNTPTMFATTIQPKNNIESQKDSIVNVTPPVNKNMAVTKKDNTINNQHPQQVIVIDTTPSFAHNKNFIKQDSSVNIIKNQVNPVVNNEKYLAVNNTNENNIDINKSYDAIFSESKYSHFRDMTESVPFESIQPYASGISNVNVWNVVEEGSKGISALTGADIDIKKKTDKKRKTDNYSFKIGRFGVSRTVHK
jgi:hypothetical protein